jgi:hypothetical protein
LVIVIDELDRCRPNYAIQVLEKIKHLFSIPGIVFVLGIDREQIGFSIETLYGKGMDVTGYLSRFIDIDYHLPEPDRRKFIETKLQKHGVDEFFSTQGGGRDKDELPLVLNELTMLFKVSFRDIEKFFPNLLS